jgi:eukaryotic-like serine/threonine-protein kinase
MRLECPNCHVTLHVVDDSKELETSCPSCGSRIPLEDRTETYRQVVADRIGPYELLNRVGIGQFGAVWRAKDTRLGRIVALKIPRREEFDDSTRAMFLREARNQAMLEHPNIVRIHEVSDGEGPVYIDSEFINGETLKDRLSGERYPYRRVAEVMATIAGAVHFAHEKGLVHRDLKPGNILLDTEGEPHVADFGLAKHIGGDFTMSITGVILGTPAYMSPEQARGDSRLVDRRSDVFSLGVVLYEMLTGTKPFEGSSQIQLLQQIQSRDPRRLRAVDGKIPRDLETICLKALAKTADRRYATAGELADDLQRFLDGKAIRARPEGYIEKGIRWVQRNQSLAGAGSLAILSTATAIVFARPGRDQLPAIPPGATMNVEIDTEPTGASVVFVPRDPLTGEGITDKVIRPAGKTPVVVEMPPGEYFVVAKLDDGRFHEVQRYVPRDAMEFTDLFRHRSWAKKPSADARAASDKDVITLARIVIPANDVAQGMTVFEGSPHFTAGIAGETAFIPGHACQIDPFYLDTHEVTIGEFLSNNQGLFPRNLKPLGDPWPQDFPLTHLLLDSAIEYAESIGKRLPTEFEYEFAATNGGTTRFPWGNDPLVIDVAMSAVMQPDFDRTRTDPPVFGLFSNGAEFTGSWHAPYPMFAESAKSLMPSPGALVTIRGGPIGGGIEIPPGLAVDAQGARMRLALARTSCVHDRIGFRCAKSKSPRW